MVLPLAWPVLGADGKTENTEVALKKNTTVIVSIIETNRSKKIWGEDAEEWKPDRWLQPLPDSVAKARVPGVYSSLSVFKLFVFNLELVQLTLYQRMTFIGGGRACM